MKGDFTRFTFNPKKHYSSVLMQQGRVVLDADWNEQADILKHIRETEAVDVIGRCGAPLDFGGFEVTPEGQGLKLSPGRIYVDGILCEIEEENHRTFENTVLPGTYIAYLDVWDRHITSLEDGEIREKALGGSDTTTRTKTEWTLRFQKCDQENISCQEASLKIKDLINPADSHLAVRLQEINKEASNDPCIALAGSSYSGLENHLYRVEIHRPGKIGEAWFKWSRDNGAMAFAIAAFTDELGKPAKDTINKINRVKLHRIGWDQEQRIHIDDVVEVLGDETELLGVPGTLAKVEQIDETNMILTLSEDLRKYADETDPIIRRWDMGKDNIEGIAANLNANKDGWIELEKGIEVRFNEDDRYHTGDYWLIPARSTGEIEWPPGEDVFVPKFGIRHRGCPLAILSRKEGTWELKKDCRKLFSPLTDILLILLSYAGGDGQEAMPGNWLPEPFKVRVTRGDRPFEGAQIEFKILEGGQGVLDPADGLVLTGKDGIASCNCYLNKEMTSPNVRIAAKLLDIDTPDEKGNPSHPTIFFYANASVAEQVQYIPPDECRQLKGATTVKDAIKSLCSQVSFAYAGGDGQEAIAGKELPVPFRVRVTRGSYPVELAGVKFAIAAGNGSLRDAKGKTGPELEIPTDLKGIATCYCSPEANVTIEAKLIKPTPIDQSPIWFNAGVSTAEQVAYEPTEGCRQLHGVKNVKEAIEGLCSQVSFAYAGGDGQEAIPGIKLPAPFQVRVSRGPYPVEGATVNFKIEEEKGELRDANNKTGQELKISTDAEGIAACYCTLNGTLKENVRIEAKLITPAPSSTDPSHTIWFNASPSIAELVACDPRIVCSQLKDVHTVMDAINGLCNLSNQVSFTYAGGDGQEALAGQTLPDPFRVMIRKGALPFEGAKVAFTVNAGGGKLKEKRGDAGQENLLEISADENAIATCYYELDKKLASGAKIEVSAALVDTLQETAKSILFHPQISRGRMLTTWVHGKSFILEEAAKEVSIAYDDKSAMLSARVASTARIFFSIPVTLDSENSIPSRALEVKVRLDIASMVSISRVIITDGGPLYLEAADVPITNGEISVSLDPRGKPISFGIGITLEVKFIPENDKEAKISFSAAGCAILANF
jgi:hypothetical protein